MKRIVLSFIQRVRKIIFRLYSNNQKINGTILQYQPVVFRGKGQILFGNGVTIGVEDSPKFHSTYAYIESRHSESMITFGKRVNINNNFSVIAERAVSIGDDVLIGVDCSISDSNFHDLDHINRRSTDPNPKPVKIGNNVFLGNNVTILKGVKIGENSAIGANSIVTKDIPKNCVAVGCPARVIKKLSPL